MSNAHAFKLPHHPLHLDTLPELLARVVTLLGKRVTSALLAAALAVGGLTALRALDLPLLVQARLAIFDGYQRLAPRPAQSAPVTVVDIDDRSTRSASGRGRGTNWHRWSTV